MWSALALARAFICWMCPSIWPWWSPWFRPTSTTRWIWMRNSTTNFHFCRVVWIEGIFACSVFLNNGRLSWQLLPDMCTDTFGSDICDGFYLGMCSDTNHLASSSIKAVNNSGMCSSIHMWNTDKTTFLLRWFPSHVKTTSNTSYCMWPSQTVFSCTLQKGNDHDQSLLVTQPEYMSRPCNREFAHEWYLFRNALEVELYAVSSRAEHVLQVVFLFDP